MFTVSGLGHNGSIVKMYYFLNFSPSDKQCGQTLQIVVMGINGSIKFIKSIS